MAAKCRPLAWGSLRCHWCGGHGQMSLASVPLPVIVGKWQWHTTNEYWRSGGLDNLFEPKCITGLGCGKVARPVLLFER